MKKSVLKVMTVLMLFVLWGMCFTVYANEEEYTEIEIHASDMASYVPDVSDSGEASLYSEDIYTRLANGFANFETKIPIAEYGFTSSYQGIQEISDAFCIAVSLHPELFYVSSDASMKTDIRGRLTYFVPKYTTTDKEVIAETTKKIETAADEIIAKTNESMSDIEKLLVIHDQIVLNTHYDGNHVKRTTMEVLLEHTGVCQSYSSTYLYLAEKVGIKSGFVISNAMNHMWNIFYIDGVWYNCDATWDDVYPAVPCCVEHTYFLKSDNYFKTYQSAHTDFEPAPNTSTADVTKYDDYFWNNTISPIIVLPNYMYYIETNSALSGIIRYDVKEKTTKTIYTINSRWSAPGGLWRNTYSGLGFYNGRLYFNDANNIYSCNLSGGDKRKEATVDSSVGQIYGLYADDNIIHYRTGPQSNPNQTNKQFTLTLPKSTNNQFYITGYSVNGSYATLSYLNGTGSDCTVVIYITQGTTIGQITKTKVIDTAGSFQISSSFVPYAFTIVALDKSMHPISMEQITLS